MLHRCSASLALFAILGVASGQEANKQRGMIGGYTVPGPASFAAGQIGTLYVFGVGEDLFPLRDPRNPVLSAPSVPLPFELGGFSVVVKADGKELNAAIASIRGCCSTGRQMGVMITLQWPAFLDSEATDAAEVLVRAKGLEIASDRVFLRGEARILSGCAATPANTPEWATCSRHVFPTVTHSDGTLVRSSNPARGGETLVVYAVGLGWVEQLPVATGAASPSPAIDITSRIMASLDFAYDGGRNPQTEKFLPVEYAGLTPGAVGLYQVHVKVPEGLPPGLLACTTDPRAPVESNLSIGITVITRGSRRDRIGICVDPSGAAGKASTAKRSAAPVAPRFDPIGFPIGHPGVQ